MGSDQIDADDNAIAVIGMAGRFPGASNVDEFWAKLRDGVESIHRFSDDELRAAGESDAMLHDPAYVKANAVLDDIDKFDAGFFGWSPRDAAVTDPQHRIFIETAWAAVENAGYDPQSCAGPVAVFASCGMNSYMMYHLVTNREVMETLGEWLVRHSGNDPNFLATRTSYELNLTGPSMNVQTACSSSLVAVHLACQSLLNGECDLALAGGSTIVLPQDRGYMFKEGEILSPDGHCRPFDAASAGTLFGSGVGCVVLKRLADALADGDHVVALVKGSAVNNDGSQKVGYLAPSVEGQAKAIAEALAVSGVAPESISYVEAHGTGTSIGDPIEVTALTQAYRSDSPVRANSCAIGSLKSNIGHLGEAAGIAGFIKTALALQHKEIPASLNFETPNPQIDFSAGPFYVNTRRREWLHPADAPRRAGITALGAGGTNVHAVLEEAPTASASEPSRPWQLVVLSAKTPSALDRATARLVGHIESHPSLDLGDAAFTLQTGRHAFPHRRIVAGRDAADVVSALKAPDPKRVFAQAVPSAAPSVVFMFPGGGAQYVDMGAELYATEPVYRDAIDQCNNDIRAKLGCDLVDLLFSNKPSREAAAERLERPSLALPALFATEYAVAMLLMSWGVKPAAMIGHSMGEYVAACLAGVFTRSAGMELVALRGRLFETVPAGGMLSIALPADEARAHMSPQLSFAAINAPELCVASGPVDAIAETQARLEVAGIESTRIHISVAAHSAMLEPILAEFDRYCRGIRFNAPQIPFVSNLTGTWIDAAEACDPAYWVRHLRNTVKFSDGLATLLAEPNRVLLEVGPGRTLSSLARAQPLRAANVLTTLRHPNETASDAAFLLTTLGKLWTTGVTPDWAALHGGAPRRRVPLPAYPFARDRHWIEAKHSPVELASARDTTLRKKPDLSDWFYLPSWRRAMRSSAPAPLDQASSGAEGWLVFADQLGVADALEPQLGGVIRVAAGAAFERRGPDAFTIRPDAREDYERLFEAVKGRLPSRVLHLWALGATPADPHAARALYFDSVFLLAQMLGNEERPIQLSIVADGLQQVAGETQLAPLKALLLGPTRVIPHEFANIATRCIDIEFAPAGSWQLQRNCKHLAAELMNDAAGVDARVVALRGGDRWLHNVERSPLPLAVPSPSVQVPSAQVPSGGLRRGGVYLITGGLGGIGLVLAEHLARTVAARLVLVGRSAIPGRETWDALVAKANPTDATAQRIRRLRDIEGLGAELLIERADVTDAVQMRAVVQRTIERFGALHGVFHAAGTIADELMLMKSLESAHSVIAPKVDGAMALDAALRGVEHDFLVLFSSVSALLGLQGQVDYSAANAFLDAFARERSTREAARTIAVNWSAWQNVGMAAVIEAKAAHRSMPTPAGEAFDSGYPWLEQAHRVADEVTFTTAFSRERQWLLGEHVIRGGDALIPGTGYLELARAGFEAAESRSNGAAGPGPNKRALQIVDVFFLAPFVVAPQETRELRLVLRRPSGEFSFASVAPNGAAAPTVHATGKVAYVAPRDTQPRSLETIRARCAQRVERLDGFMDQRFMDFGSRWANLESIHYGSGEALVALRLRAGLEADLSMHALHPALLDMATGSAQALIPGFDRERDFYVPFSYGRLTLRRALPARLFSHVRRVEGRAGDTNSAIFDIELLDEHGEPVCEIADFVMRRVADRAALARTSAEPAAPRSAGANAAASALAVFREGMSAAEGMQALDRILASVTAPQVTVCSVDLHDWIAQTDAVAVETPTEAGDAATGIAAGLDRPALSTAFVAPRDDLERDIAAIWQKMLGIGSIGVHDDFFEVGGHSLLLTQTVTRIRKMAGVDVPLRSLFARPTVGEIAEEIRKARGSGAPGDAPPPAAAAKKPALTAVSREQYRVAR